MELPALHVQSSIPHSLKWNSVEDNGITEACRRPTNNITTKTTGPNMHLSSTCLPLQHQEKEMKLSLPHWIQYSPCCLETKQGKNLKVWPLKITFNIPCISQRKSAPDALQAKESLRHRTLAMQWTHVVTQQSSSQKWRQNSCSDTYCCMSILYIIWDFETSSSWTGSFQEPFGALSRNRTRHKSHTSKHRNDIRLSNKVNSPHSSFAFFTTNNPSLPSKETDPPLGQSVAPCCT